MQLRADYDVPVVVTPDDYEWVPSPVAGVDRMMFERDGDEVAVATSLVRFQAGVGFPHHVHERGEEFIVLEGDFADADDVYPAIAYARHPAGTEHEPWSDSGCLLFVKLRQFGIGDDTIVHVRPSTSTDLHSFADELVSWIAGEGTHAFEAHEGCLWECFVVAGQLSCEGTIYPQGTWIRTALNAPLHLGCTSDTVLWVKRRPLAYSAFN